MIGAHRLHWPTPHGSLLCVPTDDESDHDETRAERRLGAVAQRTLGNAVDKLQVEPEASVLYFLSQQAGSQVRSGLLLGRLGSLGP